MEKNRGPAFSLLFPLETAYGRQGDIVMLLPQPFLRMVAPRVEEIGTTHLEKVEGSQ